MLQVGLNVHNKVQFLESSLQLVTVYVGPFAIALLALRFKLHVVYDEAMSAWAGIHFVALTHTYTDKGNRIRCASFNKALTIFLYSTFVFLMLSASLPEYYPVEFCLGDLVLCTPFQVL